MIDFKSQTEIVEFLAFITWAIITCNNPWNFKIAKYAFQGIQNQFHRVLMQLPNN